MEGKGDPVVKSADKSVAYFTYGRFQPPTMGHAGLIQTVKEKADISNADAFVFVSSTINKMDKYIASKKYKEMLKTGVFESIKENENPLSVYQKVKYLKKMHGAIGINIVNPIEFGNTNIVDIAELMGPKGLGYEKLVMLVGSDRVASFKKAFTGKSYVTIEPFGVKRTAGGISGTKMRLAAVAGRFEEFKTGVMTGEMTEKDVFDLMNDIRVGLAFDPIVLPVKALPKPSNAVPNNTLVTKPNNTLVTKPNNALPLKKSNNANVANLTAALANAKIGGRRRTRRLRA